ncbi:hypothetical protein [Hyalangium minutum]|uniref:Lipoprotein n=1 Tax=Hyalangium minutum TaxID=394096 RepID=A0A085WIX0_9BACT|nr:hypothetical protein [Hyalangium minutum]KFE67633.1 hypothetical protein DB31_8116 [Hyalangium minutum]
MKCYRLDALALALLTACATTPAPPPTHSDSTEWELAALRYEAHLLTVSDPDPEPEQVTEEDFHRAMSTLLPAVPLSTTPKESAQWLLSQPLGSSLLAEVGTDRRVHLTPLDENSPLDSSLAQELRHEYARVCHELNAGADCLGLQTDGPVLTLEDARILALAIGLAPALQQLKHSLKEMVQPAAVLSLIVWTCAIYLAMWMLPEPVSKVLAASLTVGLIAWLGGSTVWNLMDGWVVLVKEVDGASSVTQVRAAGEKYGRVLGENTSHVLVMLVTAALGGTVAKFAKKLPQLPGFSRAAARAEAQGTSLQKAAQVEEVAVSSEGTFSVLQRAAVAEEAATTASARSVFTIIRHRLGNMQVFINGQRWHVPATTSLKKIPTADPVGDALQAAAQQAARTWSPSALSPNERQAINEARRLGKHLKAHLLERMARGRFVENALRAQFKLLKWSRQGVDAIDPATGLQYEILSGTRWNMEMHGRRMADELFRLIAF